jgi:hypothetical protein
MYRSHAVESSQIVNGRNVALINIWFWPLMIWQFARRHRYAKIKTVMLEHRHCPHCGYPLRGLRPDEHDGATVCSECGCGPLREARHPLEERRPAWS